MSRKEENTSQEKAKKALAPRTSKRKKKVTVVEVELKGKQKKAKKSASTAKGGAKKTAKRAPSTNAALRKDRRKSLSAEVETCPDSPSEAALKSFRKASRRQRKAAEEKQKKTRRGQQFLAKPPRKGRKYVMDLRIHSPGTNGYFSSGDVDPGPALVRLAKIKGLNVIALTDYFNATYIDLVQAAAEKTKLTIVPGVVLRCQVGECEDVHMVSLFPEDKASGDIFAVMRKLGVPESAYGSHRFCLKAPVEDILGEVESAGGVVLPSRLDKTPYRQLAIPTLVEEHGIHAFDLVHPENTEYFRTKWPDGRFTFFSFSKANALAQVGNRTSEVKLSVPGFEGIRELVQRRQ